MKHLQQLKKENSDVQDQKSNRIKEETPEDPKKVLEDETKKNVKEEFQNLDIIKEEEVDNVKSGTGDGEDVPVDIEAVKTENTKSSAKAKCKPLKNLKKKASPSFGEISPFRRKKSKT